MRSNALESQVRRAVWIFMSQYSPVQQQVLRRALLTELDCLHHQLMQLTLGESIAELKHSFLGITRCLALHETLSVPSITSVDPLLARVRLLLKVVREENHGQ